MSSCQIKKKQLLNHDQQIFFQTKKGFSPNNPNKINQDSLIIVPNINKKTWQHFFAVCDGHGSLGHYVSGFIKHQIENNLINKKQLISNYPQQGLKKLFKIVAQKLANQSKIDTSFSGSTCVGIYFFNNKLYCANIGDSRAIIGKKSFQWKSHPLSYDHKPYLQKEAERIFNSNGRIQSVKDTQGRSFGPLRIWVKQQNIPGLAMTRSLGDSVAASVGVSCQPQILCYQMTNQDKIIVIGTDGLFQFLKNDDIITCLIPFYEQNNIEGGTEFLLNKAHNSWINQCNVIDDITFIVIFMNYND